MTLGPTSPYEMVALGMCVGEQVTGGVPERGDRQRLPPTVPDASWSRRALAARMDMLLQQPGDSRISSMTTDDLG